MKASGGTVIAQVRKLVPRHARPAMRCGFPACWWIASSWNPTP
ncbi:hypothetical protein ACU4GD_18200 [Cupriavidus basilensis]